MVSSPLTHKGLNVAFICVSLSSLSFNTKASENQLPCSESCDFSRLATTKVITEMLWCRGRTRADESEIQD